MQCNRIGNIRHVVTIVEWTFSAASTNNTKEDCSFFLRLEIDRVQPKGELEEGNTKKSTRKKGKQKKIQHQTGR
jgi:hypothetical protein